MINSVSSTYLKIIIVFNLNSRAQTQDEKTVLKDEKKKEYVLLKLSIRVVQSRPLSANYIFTSLPLIGILLPNRQ